MTEKVITLSKHYKLPAWVKRLKYKARDYAAHYGLNVMSENNLENEVIFEVLDFKALNKIAAKGGFPKRYPHWRFGMEYEKLEKAYAYGLQKIYEMVINSKPYYAYLLEANNPVDQKIVIAHVFAHVDFFRTNYFFQQTKVENMIDELANHGVRVEKYIEKYGKETVDNWLDICLSLENLIDVNSLGIKRKTKKEKEEEEITEEPAKFFQNQRYKEYMDDFINPPEVIAKEREIIKAKREALKKVRTGRKNPEEPEFDILKFLIEYAPLENWQRDILSIIRKEAYYFAPQGRTKIMNEGWASYWHSKILTGSDKENEYMKDKALPPLLTDEELIDYADHHSGTLGQIPGRLNPYKMGMELFKHIEDRWNKGKFGKEWEDCLRNGSYEDQRRWNKNAGLGRAKIFEVRKIYNDIGFIDEFMDMEFCAKQKMFTYKFNEDKNWYEIASRDYDVIKKTFLFQLTNMGQPFISVEDANYENKGELYCKHKYFGIELNIGYAKAVLENTYAIWQRPVHIETVINDSGKILSFNGKEHSEKNFKIE